MAITYTYSFNCTIKYRLSTEADDIAPPASPTFSDSSVLYSCTTNTAEVENIKVPLPAYLQGTDANLQWYLSKEYAASVVSGQELTASQWTLTNRVDLGTFTSYDATITLYTNSAPKKLIWKYRKNDTTYTTSTANTWQLIPDSSSSSYDTDYANFLSLYAPKIPTWVANKNGNNSTLYVFTAWLDPKEVIKDKEYTIDADYSETTYDETNPYTLNSKNPFTDAEPYHYGVGTPPDGYFIPIGEDEDPTTLNDVKVQAAENNGYSLIKDLDGFEINGKPIQYIEKGTFPLLKTISSKDSAGEYNLVINYNTNKEITSIKFAEVNCYDATTQTGPLYNDLKHSNEKFPKRLGFILVGGGGGSGGGGRYDPDKDAKNSAGDFIIPGGGGGGGEIVYGVLDISYEAAKKLLSVDEPNSLTYTIKIGPGGSAGAHKISEGASSGGHNGDPGNNGEDSIIYVYKSSKEEFVRACGGFGGGGATSFTLGTGGDGGSYSNNRNIASIASNYNCIIAGSIKGGKGGYPTSQTSVENENLAFSIYFSNTVPPTDPNYMLSQKHAASSKTYSTDENTDAAVFQTPGGHSFGSGAILNAGAAMGGGGGCFAVDYRDGAAGYFGLYY